MQAMIQRLREEKASLEQNSFDNGKIEGHAWAKLAAYPELIYAVKYDYNPDYRGVASSILDDHVIGKYFKDVFKQDHFMSVEPGEQCLNYYASSWVKGWFDGVHGLWRKVEDQI